jgi:hypothetical protein
MAEGCQEIRMAAYSEGTPWASNSQEADVIVEAYVQSVPKAELHIHLEGSIQPSTLLTLAERNRIELPATTEAGLRQWFAYRNFAHFIEIYVTVSRCLARAKDFELITCELGEHLGSHTDPWRRANRAWRASYRGREARELPGRAPYPFGSLPDQQHPAWRVCQPEGASASRAVRVRRRRDDQLG